MPINIDDIIVHENLIKQHRITRRTVNWTPCFRIDPDDEDNIETDPNPPTDVSKTYEEIILEDTPIHYWRLDELSTASPADDIGSGNNDGTYTAGVNLGQTGAIIGDGDPGTAAQFQGTTDTLDLNDHDVGAGSEQTLPDMSFEFWVKIPSLARATSQLIFGKKATANTESGRKPEFAFSVGSYDRVVTNGSLPSTSLWLDFYAYAPDQYRPITTTQKRYRTYVDIHNYVNEWVHVVGVIKNGHRTLYLNGQLVSWSQYSYRHKKTTGDMRAGYLGSDFSLWWEQEVLLDASNNPIPVYMDEIAIYSRALTISDISQHYNIGRNFYNINIDPGEGGGGGTGPGNTDPCDPTVIPTLGVAADISDKVLEYAIDYDANQLVESLTMTVTEDWPFEDLKEQLNSNTYLIVEERYRTLDEQHDTGWFSIGHFLVDGPNAKDITAMGQKAYKVSARGLLKLTTFDTVNKHVVPDIIFVPRSTLTRTLTTLETYEYQKARPGFTGEYYENWTEVPNIRLWVSGFTTTGDIVNASTPPIRIRGAENSIQVVGGAGKVVFDRTFFESRVNENGLGFPTTVEGEFFRYATNLDIALVDLVGSATTFSGGVVTDAYFEVSDPSASINLNESFNGKTLIIKSGGSAGRMYIISSVELSGIGPNYLVHVLDMHGKLPDLSGLDLAVGDSLQLGDCNLIEDALAKVLFIAGFQNEDATQPFYFELEPPPFPVLVPPIRYEVEDNIRWSEVINEILEFGPPNYKLYTDEDGVTRTTTVVQKPVEAGEYDHEITKLFDISQERDDLGIFTRVLGRGRATYSENVGLHIDKGGFSDVGAYKLDNFFNGNASGNGNTLSQAAADDVMEQIPDGNPKTPNMTSSTNSNYGIIYNRGGGSIQRWTMEDTDFMWMDIGMSSSDLQYLIDFIQVTVLPAYRDGSVLKQTMYIYYMTEDDYILETGHVPPATAGNATVQTNMATLKNSDRWKLLVDEFECQDGQTSIDNSEFVFGKPVRLRFLKFRVGQPYFRFAGGSSNFNIVRIVCSDIKVWTSPKILQLAKLGYTPPFDTQEHKDLFARLRQRTFVLEENLVLDTAAKVEEFAIRELQERYTEFSPWGINCFSPAARLHNTIRLRNPDTGEMQHFLIRKLQRIADVKSSSCLIQASDYLTFEVQ